MLNWIKSYFVPKTAKLKVISYLMEKVEEGKDLFTCHLVSKQYPKPVQIWYQRQATWYAKRYKVSKYVPFSTQSRCHGKPGLAYLNQTTSDFERLVFLEVLKLHVEGNLK